MADVTDHAYTVGAVARLAGVSVRTLHHYDRLGLLMPGARTPAGYRQYSLEDLRQWERLTPDRPWITGPHASGSARYFDAVAAGDEWWIYYELTRPDGAHDLRLHRAPPS